MDLGIASTDALMDTLDTTIGIEILKVELRLIMMPRCRIVVMGHKAESTLSQDCEYAICLLTDQLP